MIRISESLAGLLLAVSLVALAGCPSPDTADPDVGSDAGSDLGAPDAGGGDAGVDMAKTACTYQSDCAADEVCAEAVCEPSPECPNERSWKFCTFELEKLEAGLGRRGWCADDGHCEAGCILDIHCPGDQTCTDGGYCRDFEGQMTGEAPGEGGAPGALQAGFGEALLDFPIGMPLAGFGSRGSSEESRYGDALRPSHGQFHALRARALLLDNGARQLMIVRLPIIFPTGALHEALARRLQAETGHDWRDSLVVTGTHTHSGPGRFMHLPRNASVPLGAIGSDTFHDRAFDWMVDSTFAATKAALEDRSPARLGWSIVEAFDTDDLIASDRWGESPPFDDNRLMILRVDDEAGVPRAVLVSFGMHGTFYSDDFFNGDAPAAVEFGLERHLAGVHDRRVPVMYINENGGTMSPRGDHRAHKELHRFEAFGRFFADRVADDVAAVQTKSDGIELGAVTHRFPITYDSLGYEENEWFTIFGGRYDLIFGGLLCVGGADDDPATYTPPERLNCTLPGHIVAYNHPITLFARSQISALSIDGLTVVTLPGEPSMELGWQVVRELRDRQGLEPLDTFIWGYAQDHLLYLMPTNLRGELPVFPGISTPKAPDEYPDFAFSYLQGGYEAGTSMWGWKLGDFMVERAVEAVALLADPQAETQLPAAMPDQFGTYGSEDFPVEVVPLERAGTVTVEPPSEVARMTPIEFAWLGGDPGAEAPQAPHVMLERRTGGDTWEMVERPGGAPYDNRDMLMLTRLRRTAEDDFEWVVYWEELEDFEAGTYRFRVEGHTRTDEGRRSYEAVSRGFEVVAREDLEVALESASTTEIVATVSYPAAAALDISSTEADPAALSGSYRMRHPEVGTGIPDPPVVGEDLEASGVTVRLLDGGATIVEVDAADVTLESSRERVGGRADTPVTRLRAALSGVAPGSYTLEIEVRDRHGNTGTLTQGVDL